MREACHTLSVPVLEYDDRSPARTKVVGRQTKKNDRCITATNPFLRRKLHFSRSSLRGNERSTFPYF